MVPVVIPCVNCFVQLNSLSSSLLAKPLHGQFFCFVNGNVVDKQKSFAWLKQHLHSETILAIQNQVIATRVIESKIMHKFVPSLSCRLCGSAEETIVHLLSACSVLAPTAYLHQYNLVVKAIHWHLMRVYSFPRTGQSWRSHGLESSDSKILWDFNLRTDHNHSSNRPDIVIFDYRQRTINFIQILCPADINVAMKEEEKLLKYSDLAADFHHMYGMPVVTVPVVLGCSFYQMFNLFEETSPNIVC